MGRFRVRNKHVCVYGFYFFVLITCRMVVSLFRELYFIGHECDFILLTTGEAIVAGIEIFMKLYIVVGLVHAFCLHFSMF